MAKTRYKLVAFDLDGTIISNIEFIWKTIHEHLSTDNDARKGYRDKFFRKEISYEQWAKLDVQLWKKMGARKKDILGAIKGIRLVPGALKTLHILKKKGYRLAVISGSIDIALEKVLPEYAELFDYVYLNRLYFRKDGRILRIKATRYDFEHKLTGLKDICMKEGISLAETVFIGDHDNDVQIAKKAGLAIAFCPNSRKLEKVSDVVVKKRNLAEILKYILL